MKALSNQAQWYFNGNFPVYRKPPVGHAAPEPKAMQELVDAGLVFFQDDFILGAAWFLTEEGCQEKYKNFLRLSVDFDTSTVLG